MTIVAVCNVGVMVFISRVSPYCRRGRIAGASELYTFSLLYTVMGTFQSSAATYPTSHDPQKTGRLSITTLHSDPHGLSQGNHQRFFVA